LSTWPNAARVASGLDPGSLPIGQVGIPAVGQLLRQQAVEQLLAVRFALRPGVEVALPLVVGLFATGDKLAGVLDDIVAHLEGLVRVEAKDLLDRGDLLVTERGAMRLAGVHQVRGGITDDRAH
jgi:hypothetical protein